MKELVNALKSWSKYLLSFRKRDWSLSDYPVEFRRQDTDESFPGSLGNSVVVKPWEARIIKWYWMNGTGETKEQALEELRNRFNAFKAEGNPLPRPGIKVPLRFAETDEIEQYGHIAEEFFPVILDIDYGNILFISDDLRSRTEDVTGIYRLAPGMEDCTMLKEVWASAKAFVARELEDGSDE
jgi:hypothetical protein